MRRVHQSQFTRKVGGGALNTENLRHVLAVAETGSFSAAARLNGVTQPAVSLAVKKMEKEFGVKLFDRAGGRYSVTGEGALVIDHAKRILELEDRLVSDLQLAREALAGKLRIAASNIPGEYVLPLIIGEFKSRFPGLEPVLEVSDSHHTVQSVLSGGVEVGFMGISLEKDDLEVLPFCPDSLVVVAPPKHPLTSRSKVDLKQLLEENFILREEGSGTRQLMLDALQRRGIASERLRVEMELGSTSSVLSAVESGIGITLVSIWAARTPISEGRLSRLKVPGLSAKRQFSLIRLRSKDLSAAGAAFVKYVEEKRPFLKRHANSFGSLG